MANFSEKKYAEKKTPLKKMKHMDEKEDKALVRKMVKKRCVK
jgi:hypothetical protein